MTIPVRNKLNWCHTHIEIDGSRKRKGILEMHRILLDLQQIVATFYVFSQFNWTEVLVIDIGIQELSQFLQVANRRTHSNDLNAR